MLHRKKQICATVSAGDASAVWDAENLFGSLSVRRVWEAGFPVWRGKTPRSDPYTLGAKFISRPIQDGAPATPTPSYQTTLHLQATQTLALQCTVAEIVIPA
jgi:hypothetical protein